MTTPPTPPKKPFTTTVQLHFTSQSAHTINYEQKGEVILTIYYYRRFIGKDLSEQVMIEDIICVLLGCLAPAFLRRVGAHYEFIRSVYIDGITHGEPIEALKGGELGLEDFELH